jgi:hypothetical protein
VIWNLVDWRCTPNHATRGLVLVEFILVKLVCFGERSDKVTRGEGGE